MSALSPRPFNVIILTGGASRRMGADKASQIWGDHRAIDHVVGLAQAVGAERIITAGAGDFGLPRALDPAPFSGPVAGVVAGLALLGPRAERVLVLAVDAPTILPADLEPLLEAAEPGACFIGLPLPMIFARRAAPFDAQNDWPLRRFVERAGLTQLPLDAAAQARVRGANTPQERDRLSSAP